MRLLKKKDKILDLTNYESSKPKNEKIRDLTSKDSSSPKYSGESSGGIFGFFSGIGKTETSSGGASEEQTNPPDLNERRQKLIGKLKEMTGRIEDLSMQIYRLQQRVELLERKLDAVRS